MTKALPATVVVLALTCAACGGGGGSDCTSENATKLTRTLMMKDHRFSPNCFSVDSGSTISVANRDSTAHNFTVRGTDVAVGLLGGKSGEVTAPAPGKYDFVCTIHQGMKGTMIVT